MAGKRDTLENRFWAKVDQRGRNECWPWLATANNKGYGLIQKQVDGRNGKRLAHRISYELRFGPIDPDICVLHRCDNPICVNPSHLFLGSKRDNIADMIAKGRGRAPPHMVGASHGGAKLTEKQAYYVLHTPKRAPELACELGVLRSVINRIRSGKSWTHLSRAGAVLRSGRGSGAKVWLPE